MGGVQSMTLLPKGVAMQITPDPARTLPLQNVATLTAQSR